MSIPLHVLILEDQPADAELTLHALRRAGFAPVWQRVETEAAYLAALDPSLDLILADYVLPQFDGLRALDLLRARGLDIPLILVSGTIGEEVAVAAMQRGATDYLLKDRLARIGTAVEHALTQRRLRVEMQRADQALRQKTALIQLFQEVAVAANEATSFEQALQTAVDTICTHIGWPVGHVYLPDPDMPEALLPTSIWHLEDAQRFTTFRTITEVVRLAPGVGLPGQALASRKPAWVSDMILDDSTPRTRLIQDIGVRAGFALPVLLGDDVAAVLEFFATEAIAPDAALLDVLQHVGTQLGRVVERARAEAALRMSEERFRVLFEHSPDAIILIDPHDSGVLWPIVECNDLACRMNGYTRDELIGQSIDMLNGAIGSRAERAEYIERLRREGTLRFEVMHGRKDGSLFPIEVVSSLISVAGRELVLGIDRDISARKQAEEALRAAEAQYRTLVEQIPAIIYTAAIDEHSSTRYVSPQIEATLGFSPEEWLANPDLWLELVHPEDRPLLLETIGRAHINDAPIPVEFRSFTRDGRVVWLRDAARVVRDDTGQPLFMQGITLDITDRKQAEEALIEERALLARRVDERTADLSAANAELARTAMLKDEFLASMSHELRTPLNAVLGLSEALQEEVYGPINDRQRRSLHSIEESGRHLLELINDILDLAKIGAGQLELVLEPASIATIGQASLRLIAQLAQQKQLSVSSVIDPTVTLLNVDARRVKQILVNLLSNAVKFTPTGGSIGLAIVGDTTRQAVDLAVWDTGIGIAHEHMGDLFQPFVQLDSRLARQYEGTGLGLALVYRMVELHGGSITVTSEVGQGSRFTVSLPWYTPNAGKPASTPVATDAVARDRPPVRAIPPLLVLLAEDNAATSTMVADYLGERGYQVVVARNGAEAIARVHEVRPVIVLMDIQMPGMDGLEATRRIRANADLADLPIIALTALAMPGDRERCLAAGANAYLSKPVSLRGLASLIETTLQAQLNSQRNNLR